MRELVGNFQYDIGKPTGLDPSHDIDYPSSDRLFILENLILALVITAENDHDSMSVACFNDALRPAEIRDP